jgi:hypothetical protein
VATFIVDDDDCSGVRLLLRLLQGIGIAELALRDMICDVPLRY